MVKLPGDNSEEEPANTWRHYKVAMVEGTGFSFAKLVKDDFWEHYRCEDGYEQEAERVLENACKKLVHDMHYEVRIQAVVNYYHEHESTKLVKTDARRKTLTKEQYMKVPPRWVVNKGPCWKKMVDKWCNAEWEAKHKDRQLQRAEIKRIPHHQGNRNLRKYGKKLEEKFGTPVSEFQTYALSHKGPVSTVAPYNDSDGLDKYTSLVSHANMTQYKEVYKEKHGADSDPTAHPLDPEVVMVAGHGKKHGRFLMGGSLISTASVPTLPQIKARQTSSSPAIRSRPNPRQVEIEHVVEERLAEMRAQHTEENRKLQEQIIAERENNKLEMHRMFVAYCATQDFPPPDPLATPLHTPEGPLHTPEGGASNNLRSHASDNNPLGGSPQL